VPDRVEDLAARHDPAGLRREQRQHLPLARRQRDLGAGHAAAAHREVEHDLPRHQPHRRRLVIAAAGERAHAGLELGERERLPQVIVGAGVEPAHAVGDLAARGQAKNRRVATEPAQLAAQVESIAVRQHEVEHDGGEAVDQCLLEAGRVARGRDDLEPGILESGDHEVAGRAAVFDEEDSHGPHHDASSPHRARLP
jgi:hypothetical protein